MKICLVAYIQGKEFPEYLLQIQLVRYFRFSGHKLVHLDLGGAPPKLTYLLQVIPFEIKITVLSYAYSAAGIVCFLKYLVFT